MWLHTCNMFIEFRTEYLHRGEIGTKLATSIPNPN